MSEKAKIEETDRDLTIVWHRAYDNRTVRVLVRDDVIVSAEFKDYSDARGAERWTLVSAEEAPRLLAEAALIALASRASKPR